MENNDHEILSALREVFPGATSVEVVRPVTTTELIVSIDGNTLSTEVPGDASLNDAIDVLLRDYLDKDSSNWVRVDTLRDALLFGEGFEMRPVDPTRGMTIGWQPVTMGSTAWNTIEVLHIGWFVRRLFTDDEVDARNDSNLSSR